MAITCFNGKMAKSNNFLDDFNYIWTAIFLGFPAIFFIIVRTFFIRSAITCYIPAEMTYSHALYVHQSCWQNGTYLPILDSSQKLPADQQLYISSPHAWIPYMLFIMLLFFTIPQGLRHVAKRYFDMNRTPVARQVTDGGKHSAAEIAQSVFDATSRRTQTAVFMILKLFVLLNFFLHLLFIKLNFRGEVHNVGYNKSYTEEAFPGRVLCRTQIPTPPAMAVFNIQCSLPINLTYENYFVLLSLWFAFAAILSFCGFVFYALFSFYGVYTKCVMSRYLPNEDLDTILTRAQGTDGLWQLWRLCKKEDASLVRDVAQLLREIIKTTPETPPPAEESGEPAADKSVPPPEIIVESPVDQLEIAEPTDLKI